MDGSKDAPWSSYMESIYRSGKPPKPLGTVDFKEIEEMARQKLKDYPGGFLYTFGSAGTSSTRHANRMALDNYKIIPRMLVDSTNRSLEVTLFGIKYPAPVLVGPVGVNAIAHPDAELGPARAAGRLGIPYCLSTAASRTIEEVAAAVGNGPRWYQLYWPKTNEVTISLLQRAKKNGFTALIVTLDTMLLGWRPHDLQDAYIPFRHGVGTQVGLSDPAFMKRFNRQPITDFHPEFPHDPAKLDKLYAEGDPKVRELTQLGMEWNGEITSGTFRSWDDLKFLRDNWDGPLILKGIQRVQDAERAIECGVNGIVVSNHGGRQIDGTIPSLYALEQVMKSETVRWKQSSGEFTVLFDSGIRTGADIIKAIALGAQAVLIARPWIYGMMVAGEAGVEQVLRHILADLDVTMGLAGYATIADFQGKGSDVVVKMASAML
ncbi:oxidoreductase [Fistulina hepatica ATCC 64428]|uniref:Oxidoreductase n=1 Tax=Fistulina hepatica ATCC 64428 TaxID=1128425 RepID=A0A0D7AL61_9AGAR|nr:oxidoreductase [Fistulina hepatica ATCC 64428]